MANEKRLIDANTLLEKIQFRLPIDDYISECIYECVKMARQIINDAPTVDAVEVVHGRWNFDDECWAYNCSNCRTSSGVSRLFKYCPNCGAKMDGDGK